MFVAFFFSSSTSSSNSIIDVIEPAKLLAKFNLDEVVEEMPEDSGQDEEAMEVVEEEDPVEFSFRTIEFSLALALGRRTISAAVCWAGEEDGEIRI